MLLDDDLLLFQALLALQQGLGFLLKYTILNIFCFVSVIQGDVWILRKK
jgi:hypothetical protein